MKKVFLGVGHGGSDPGAVGILVEKAINLKMALACRDYLVANGVTVKMSREKDENDPIGDEVKECNAFDPDVAVDIHNNAGGGDGFECIHYSKGGKSLELAKNIEAEVKAIGQNSRGLKTRLDAKGNDYFAFIRSIKAPSVICEGVFVDNAADASQADTEAKCKAFGEAYAKGILKTLGVVSKKKPSAVSDKKCLYKVKVTANALNIRKGAGMNYSVVGCIRDHGVYTIVETKDNWGKLKSGAGWICLDFTKRC